MREPLPPKSPGIFGRESLIRETINSLFLGEHVALIGPGGIGKTSIAKAILYEDDIEAKYQNERYFIRFDDMNPESITFDTFLNRVAQSLGLPSSKTNNHKRISNYLCSRDSILLVLDNSETFLEAERDEDRIAEAIDEFGAHPSVKIVLTTRTRTLPGNLIWKRLTVMSLELNPARQAFLSIYRKDISPEIVDPLLAALDFHPLSINLLAHAAVQNEWSVEDLINAWDTQRTEILDSGTGKMQSLAVSIELSLKSRSITKLKDSAIPLLQLITFLPQGLHGKKLKDIFPTVENIQATADTLCKMSLTYRRDAFITMLSPIRLYLTSKYLGNVLPYNFPFLQPMREYYHSQLTSEDPSLEDEDINVERLIAHDLTITNDLETNIRHCLSFLEYLLSYHPRPTGLGGIIKTLPDTKPPSHASNIRIFMGFLRPHFGRRHRISVVKAQCLHRLALIGCNTGHLHEVLEPASAASRLFLGAGIQNIPHVLELSILQADVYSRLGRFPEAENSLNIVLKNMKWLPNVKCVGRVVRLREQAQCSASLVMAFMGKFEEATQLAVKTRQSLEKRGDMENASNTISNQGFISLFQRDYSAARTYFKELVDLESFPFYLLCLSEVLYQEGSLVQADEILKEAEERVTGLDDSDWTIGMLWSMKAARFADAHESDLAREYSNRAVNRYKDKGSADYALAQYGLARTELLASNYPKAKEHFTQCIDLFEVHSDVRFQARSLRALGEIALLEKGHGEASNEYFSQTQSICANMGIHPMFLYMCWSIYWLDDEKFVGWNSFWKD